MSEFRKILVPTDFSPISLAAFRTAISLAKAVGAELVVAHVSRGPVVVVENGPATAESLQVKPINLWDKFKPFVVDEAAIHVTHEIVMARKVSARAVVGLLEKFGCDLIVIGSHGHGRMHRMLRGSLTDEVIRSARCPVLVVKADRGGEKPAARPVLAGNVKTT